MISHWSTQVQGFRTWTQPCGMQWDGCRNWYSKPMSLVITVYSRTAYLCASHHTTKRCFMARPLNSSLDWFWIESPRHQTFSKSWTDVVCWCLLTMNSSLDFKEVVPTVPTFFKTFPVGTRKHLGPRHFRGGIDAIGNFHGKPHTQALMRKKGKLPCPVDPSNATPANTSPLCHICDTAPEGLQWRRTCARQLDDPGSNI